MRLKKAARKIAYVSALGLCDCKFRDSFTNDASAQAVPRCAAQAAAARAGAQSEPDGGRARHLRLLSQSPRTQSAARDGGDPAAPCSKLRRGREVFRFRG